VKIRDKMRDTDRQIGILGTYEEIEVRPPLHTFSAEDLPLFSERKTLNKPDDLGSSNRVVHYGTDSNTSPWQLMPHSAAFQLQYFVKNRILVHDRPPIDQHLLLF